MILEIQHETRVEYPSPVTETFTELRMEPSSDAHQSCRSFHLRINPPVETHRYQDGFGNRVHHINILPAHQAVTILSASVVETHSRGVDLTSCPAMYPLEEDALPLEAIAFSSFHGPVRPTELLKPTLAALAPRLGQNLGELVATVARYIKTKFEYAPAVTAASSPIDDVLRHGKGVCQDFAHLMIAVLRTFGLPARYVSGYIHRPGQESQSHAWVEIWLPSLNWVGVDPTNNTVVNDHFVRVAVGRDFTDVPPNKGIYRGGAHQKISVRVESRQLDRAPPIAWHESLPPLQAPLRAMVPREGIFAPTNVLEMEQQQQQQLDSLALEQQMQQQQQ